MELKMANENTVLMEDVRITFRNFAGREGPYNREGERNFCIILDHELATAMENDGWNVKYLKARDEDEEDQPYIQVSVNFKGPLPPRVVMITSRGRTTLDEADVEMLDWADIRMVDAIIRPYEWLVNGKTGIKAYLKSIYVTIEEDELELKYGGAEDGLPAGDR
jgi:hypothetical protein